MQQQTGVPTGPVAEVFALTRTGRTLLEAVSPLVEWAGSHIAQIDRAGIDYDSRTPGSPPPH